MDRKFLINAMIAAVLVPVVFGFGYWLYWNFILKYQPVILTKDALEVQRLLESADYVSPGTNAVSASPRAIYFITVHGCKPCAAYEQQEFPKLTAAGVDTRVIVIAPEGLDQSRPEDRTTVAELWLNRSWDLYKTWRADPHWDAAGLRPADGDLARTAVVDAGRKFLKDLTPLLTENRVSIRYPLVIWRDNDNRLKICSCDLDQSLAYVRRDFAAPDTAPVALPPAGPDATGAKPAQGMTIGPVQDAKPILGNMGANIGDFFGLNKPAPAAKPAPATQPAPPPKPAPAAASSSSASSASASAAASVAKPADYPTDYGPGF